MSAWVVDGKRSGTLMRASLSTAGGNEDVDNICLVFLALCCCGRLLLLLLLLVSKKNAWFLLRLFPPHA